MKNKNIYVYITIACIIIYILLDLLLAHLRPDYSLIHNAESDYTRGKYSYLMDINFIVRCVFSLSFVKILWIEFSKNQKIKSATYWIIAWAISSGLLAFFPDNPYGYPKLWTGQIHLFLATIAFISIIVGMIKISIILKQESLLKNISVLLLIIGIFEIIMFMLTALSGFNPHTLGGLYERIFLALIMIWQIIISIRLWQSSNLTN